MSSYPQEYSAFFSRLKGLRCSPQVGRWEAFCPAHEDGKRSLSVAIGKNGSVIVKCHAPAGCGVSSVVSALGLVWADLFPRKEKKLMSGSRSIICEYDYQNELGELLFQVIRYDPKGFSQRRPNPEFNSALPRNDGNQKFLPGVEGVRRVPYRLPQLINALKQNPQRWVLVLEGEKDVDLALKHGMAATTNPMGAGKWADAYSEFLRGANVAVWPDEDPIDPKTGQSAGLHHAEMVCESLLKVGISPRVIRVHDPKPKGDFTEWWESLPGLSIAERKGKILEMIAASQPFTSGRKLIPWRPQQLPQDQPKVEPDPVSHSSSPEALPANVGDEWNPCYTPEAAIPATVATPSASLFELLGRFEFGTALIRREIFKLVSGDTSRASLVEKALKECVEAMRGL